MSIFNWSKGDLTFSIKLLKSKKQNTHPASLVMSFLCFFD